MTIFHFAGMYYVLDRTRRTVTRSHNRSRALHNALMKCYVYRTTAGVYTYNNNTL